MSLTPASVKTLIDWYTGKLDFAVEQRWDHDGSPFALISRGDIRIELLGLAQEHGAGPPDDIAASHTVERLHHMCWATDDLEATLSDLNERGVEPINPIMENPALGMRFTFITDPIGTIIELTERVAR